MRTIAIAMLLTVLVSTTGCGLLALPESGSLPSAAFRQVTVIDDRTGNAMTQADVVYEVHTQSNWMAPLPYCAWGTGKVPDLGKVETTWQATPDGRGTYSFPRRTVRSWKQIWFPLGLPLGGVMHHAKLGRLRVAAPDHAEVWVIDPGQDATENDGTQVHDPAERSLVEIDEAVRIRLPANTKKTEGDNQ